MPAKQSVIVKGQRNGISIMLDEAAEFEQLQETLREKVSNAKSFFEGAKTNVSFKGRKLSEIEEQHLLDIILAETNLDVGFVEGSDYIAPKPKPRRVADSPLTLDEPVSKKIIPINPSLPTMKINDIEDISPLRLSHTESETAYYRGGLRSGQSIKYHGSVVIMGDVNPGSEVVAEGNVIVLGALKGMAHAGSKGDNNCFVSALVLQPTQLRIGRLITYIPVADKKAKKGASLEPSYAYIKDDQVFVAPL